MKIRNTICAPKDQLELTIERKKISNSNSKEKKKRLVCVSYSSLWQTQTSLRYSDSYKPHSDQSKKDYGMAFKAL